MPSSAPDFDGEIPTIPPGKDASERRTIASWWWNIQKAYKSVEEMKKSEVVQVDWYKCFHGLKHEYGVATIKRAGATHYIRFERHASLDVQVGNNQCIPGDETVFGEEVARVVAPTPQSRKEMEEDLKTERQVLRRAIWASVHRSVDKISKDRPEAHDTATQVYSPNGLADDNGEVQLLATYKFNPGSISLRDLVLAMYEVSSSFPTYDVLKHQCYWFVRTVVGILEQSYHPTVHKMKYFHKAGAYWVGKSNRNIERCAKINGDNIPEVQKLAGDVRTKIDEHDSFLIAEYMNGEGGRIQAEEQLKAANERIREFEAMLAATSNSGRPVNVH